MKGPDHYLAGEHHLRLAEDVALRGSEEDLPAGQLYAAIAQAHFTAAGTAALAELDAMAGPGSGSATGRTADADRHWSQVLVDDPDPELTNAPELTP